LSALGSKLAAAFSSVRVKVTVGVAVILLVVITGMTFILIDLARNDLRGQARLLFEFVAIEAGLILLLISLLLSLLVARPIEALVHVAERIAAGELAYRVEVVQQGEIGRLAVAFNRMLERLAEARAAQQRHIEDLEQAYAALKRTQAQLVASEKLASVGRLAAGIAHEIGNPLSSIHGYAEILLMDETVPERRQYIERVQAEIERITRIIQSLLDYSRAGRIAGVERPAGQRVELGAAVRRALDLVAAQPGFTRIALRSAVPERGPVVLADEHQLTQVLINLLLNAQQAAGDGGKLEVLAGSTAQRWPPGDGPWPEAPAALEQAAWVAVCDDGPGIAPEHLDKLYDPFYTTKPVGQGTGLGLFVVHSILGSLGGEVRVWSEPGKGARFVVFLPEAPAAADAFAGEEA
jgi:two-component system NtrC family sensor kinase